MKIKINTEIKKTKEVRKIKEKKSREVMGKDSRAGVPRFIQQKMVKKERVS